MKLVFGLLVMTLFVSCGKNNKSGAPATNLNASNTYLTTADLTATKQQFLERGRFLVQRYQDEIDSIFGRNTARTIQSRLRIENIDISEAILYSDNSRKPTRSNRRNSNVTLYAGSEYPNYNWRSMFQRNDSDLDRYIMNELLELVGINDNNYVYTDRILRRNRR